MPESISPTRPDRLLDGTFTPDEQMTFRHVPFDVPEGVDQLQLTITYNDRIGSDPLAFGGNTLDIGLFDERGIESGGPGFRGWSGSNKLEITVGTDWATPPYRAGAPGAGIWNVLLSAYKVGPNGLTYRVEVRFNRGHPAREQPVIPRLDEIKRLDIPAAVEPGWYRGDLHMHTIYSDGNSHPAQIAVVAVEAGLDFYGITDHNRAQSPVGLVPGGDGWPVLVPGVEVTTYAGHFNVWGTDTWYDFRDPTPEGIQAAVAAALSDGGFVSLNHPKPFGPAWYYPEVTGFHAIEAWNGWWSRLNNVSTRFWDERLRRGERMTGIGGSDMHQLGIFGDPDNPLTPPRIGHPTLWVKIDGELSPGSILDALRRGRCFISESPSGPEIYLKGVRDMLCGRCVGAIGDALLLIGANGCLAAASIDDDDITLSWPIAELEDRGTPYVRAEIHSPSGGVRALTNPVWLYTAQP